MKINYLSTTNFSANRIPKLGKKLIPLSDYKGPFLKLTPEDNKLISDIKVEITQLEMDRIGLYNFINSHKLTFAQKDRYLTKLNMLDEAIDSAILKIEAIKKARFQEILSANKQ